MDDRVRQLVTTSPRLATPPAAYFRLCQVLDDPASTGLRVAQIVRTDPSLTARVLRVSNSAAFNQKERVESVLHAVVLLGTNRIRQMALAAAVQETFRGIPASLVDMRAFWEHSIAVASGAELIGRRLRLDPETAFLTGLLHDIGLLVTCLTLPQEALRVLKLAERTPTELHHIERELLGFDHAQVGAELLSAWLLPLPAEVVRAHHEPHAAPSPMVEVIHLADLLASTLRLGWTGEHVPEHELAPTCERLRMTPADLDDVVDELREQVVRMAQSFVG